MEVDMKNLMAYIVYTFEKEDNYLLQLIFYYFIFININTYLFYFILFKIFYIQRTIYYKQLYN